MKKQLAGLTACVLAGLAASPPVTPVLSQAGAVRSGRYSNKPIRWVSGSGPDAMARILGQKITEAWSQQVVVEERGKGGGMMFADIVAHTNPMGYTPPLATGANA